MDGGASANNYIMQTQSDLIGVPGTAPPAWRPPPWALPIWRGLRWATWKSKEDVLNNTGIERIFTPAIDELSRAKRIKGWKRL